MKKYKLEIPVNVGLITIICFILSSVTMFLRSFGVAFETVPIETQLRMRNNLFGNIVTSFSDLGKLIIGNDEGTAYLGLVVVALSFIVCIVTAILYKDNKSIKAVALLSAIGHCVWYWSTFGVGRYLYVDNPEATVIIIANSLLYFLCAFFLVTSIYITVKAIEEFKAEKAVLATAKR